MRLTTRQRFNGRNSLGYASNIRYADDTILMVEREEEMKSLLMKLKEESEKDGLRLSIQQMKIMVSGPFTSWKIEGEKVEAVADFLISKITVDGACGMKLKDTCSLE